MKQIRWTKKRKDTLRNIIQLAFQGWLHDDDYARGEANEIHEFEMFLNARGLADGYEKSQLTFLVKQEDE